MTRIFRTETPTPTDELKQKIGETICILVQPYIFEIVGMKSDGDLKFTITCKITGKATDIGNQFIKETEENE